MLSAMRRTPLPVPLRGLRLAPELGRAGPPAPFGETPALVARRSLRRAVVATMRPHQWIKNGLVLATAGALGRDDVPVRVLLACAVFCLLASGIYAFNDVRDVTDDRQHPRKCRRPVGGFVLRALAGGVAAGVPLSRWFVLVVSAAAVLIAATKRLAELRRTERHGTARRHVLGAYTPELLLVIVGASAGIAVTACGVWALEVVAAHGIPWRPLTAVPFALCLVRYLQLALAGRGEAPEDLILADPGLILGGVAWVALFGLAVHVGS
jgi:4-hydroxybenzoate polyprenyltransferase